MSFIARYIARQILFIEYIYLGYLILILVTTIFLSISNHFKICFKSESFNLKIFINNFMFNFFCSTVIITSLPFILSYFLLSILPIISLINCIYPDLFQGLFPALFKDCVICDIVTPLDEESLRRGDSSQSYYIEDDGAISEVDGDKLHFPEGPRDLKHRSIRSLFSKMNHYLQKLDSHHIETMSRLNELEIYCKSRNVKILVKSGEMGADLEFDSTLSDLRIKFIRSVVDTFDTRYRLESGRGDVKMTKAGSVLDELKKRHPDMYRYYNKALDNRMDKFADLDRIYNLNVIRVIHSSNAHNIAPRLN